MDALDFEKPLLDIEKNIRELKEKASQENIDFSETIKSLEKEILDKKEKLYENLTPDQRVKISRHPKRPNTLDYVQNLFTDFTELHGDRLFGDDPAIVSGLAKLGEHRVIIIGHQKGRDTKEKLFRNFGTAHPEGYRKALRLMQMAHRFKLPVITLVDTPGAFPGVSAEERGQASAIAVNLRDMMLLEVPVISVIIGEGGSGGALGIGVADRIIMLEHAYYSVISPEGCAAILWKTHEKTPEAAKALKMTAADLLEFGIIDEIIEEPLGGAHREPEFVMSKLKDSLLNALNLYSNKNGQEILEGRQDRYRNIGIFEIEGQASKSNKS